MVFQTYIATVATTIMVDMTTIKAITACFPTLCLFPSPVDIPDPETSAFVEFVVGKAVVVSVLDSCVGSVVLPKVGDFVGKEFC